MSGSLNDDETARLLSVIAESDAVVEADGASNDPVAIRRVVDALFVKARALVDLGSFDDSVRVWDELLSQAAEISNAQHLWVLASKSWALSQAGADASVPEVVDELLALFNRFGRPSASASTVAEALVQKAYSLELTGQREAGIGANAQLVELFSATPAVSEQVSAALRAQAWRYLKDPDRLDEALAISVRLCERIANEPDETLAPVTEVAIKHLKDLERISGTVPKRLAALTGLTVADIAIEATRSAYTAMCRRVPQMRHTVPILEWLDAATDTIGPFERSHRRLESSLAISRALTRRIGEEDDDTNLRRLYATAKIYEANTLLMLGRLRESSHAYAPIFYGTESGVRPPFKRSQILYRTPKASVSSSDWCQC